MQEGCLAHIMKTDLPGDGGGSAVTPPTPLWCVDEVWCVDDLGVTLSLETTAGVTQVFS